MTGPPRSDVPLVDNPFPRRPPNLGLHAEDCAGPEERVGYIAFTGRPDPPDVAGGVVLIGGRPHLGKSVLAHRCLHRYQDAGLLLVDLAGRTPGGLPGPADCLALMRDAYPLPDELRAALRAVRAAEPVAAHDELGRALRGRRLVVRLPRPDPSLRPAAIAARALGYARAGRAANSSVYLFEYPYWVEDDWTEVREHVARAPDADLVTPVALEPFSDLELMEFLRARVGGAEPLGALFDLDPAVLLRALARQRASLSPNNLTWFNVLCHQAFATAIEARAARIALHHYLAAAVRIGAP
ncbi:hypothetical protein [Actinomadura decatromicini]|uniref:Uncharacterized protein n=1 Tax=Actinomadura decatromicini TaxID=2604572 RepID=A0A5D3FX96_9ACTN|nr:hypothetical protein [Actinomadura decatromicini]TYK52526.1 hypothetical protein FXF68_01765 [Actinomadura decatromicini]